MINVYWQWIILFCRTLRRLIWCSTLRKASWKRALRKSQGQKMTRRNPQFQQLQIRTQRDRNQPIRRMKLLNYVSYQLYSTTSFFASSHTQIPTSQSYLIPKWPGPIQNFWHFITNLHGMMSWEINQQKVFSELRNYKILSETCCFLSCYFYEGQKATNSKGRITFVTNLKGIRSAVDFISHKTEFHSVPEGNRV